MSVSRTHRTIQNSRISLLIFLVQIFVGFYSRKVFLDYLGTEIIGLNTTLGNILSFLNLAELGIGIAMSTSLFKPLHDQDQQKICEILTVQGILYRRIACLLGALSIPVLIALPFLFPNTECSIIYIYIAYIVFLSGSIFSYLWNYREVLIQADQKNYKLMPSIHGIRFGKVFLQIIILIHTPLGIWGWILLELIANILTIFAINYVIRKEYPWLKRSQGTASTLLHKYSDLMIKTKQMFVHKIASFVLEQTAPLIIYAFVTLRMVTYYGNYMMLIGYTVTLMNVIFEGMGASIGNLVAENDKKHTLEVFWELFTSRLWIAGIACFILYLSIEPFIILWLGEQYLLSETTVLLMIMGMFIRMTRSVVDSFKNAYQLFADIWSPIAEAIINLSCSILFGYFWGLNGILLGSNISLILIVLIWKPYYTFREGLKVSSLIYYAQYTFHCGVLLILAVMSKMMFIHIYTKDSEYHLVKLALCLVSIILLYTITTYIAFYLLTSSMKRFTQRIINIIKHRI